MAKGTMRKQREVFGSTLAECGGKNRNIVALNADLSSSTKTSIFASMPECRTRFWNMGIAEANMMCVAAGLATTGKVVVASTFAVFATGRAFDQIRQSICYPNLDVKIVASHAGITVGGDGGSHQSVEDIAIMRSLPNMRVVVPCDGVETGSITEAILGIPGPFYMRMGRSDVPDLLDEDTPWHFGRAQTMADGSDVTFLAIVKAASETGAIVTAEEHSIIGGLGSAVCEVVSEERCVPVRRIGIKDVFGQSGEVDELMRAYGLTAENLARTAKDLVKMRR
jgi:transketolase